MTFEYIENKGLDIFDRLKNYNIILNIYLYANQHVKGDAVVDGYVLGKHALSKLCTVNMYLIE